MVEDKILLSYDEAIKLLPDKETIHAIKQAGPMLIGADWGREDVLKAMKKSKTIEVTGEHAQSSGHGLAFYDEQGPVFIEAKRYEAPKIKVVVYTECEKLKKIAPQSQLIGEFLDWLQNTKHINLSQLHVHDDDCYETEDDGSEGERVCGMSTQSFYPVHASIEKLLAEYFKIDLNKVETEKIAMLEELRRSNGE